MRLAREHPLGACGLALAAACLGVGAASAAPWDLWRVRARVATDVVDVRLVDEGVADGARIVDDSCVEHRVGLVNEGAPCWVRVRTEVVGRDGEAVPLVPTDVCEGFRLAADGYAYLERPLDEGETVEWSELLGGGPDTLVPGGEAVFTTRVDAVQRDHVEPDLSGDAPWGGMEPMPAVVSRGES